MSNLLQMLLMLAVPVAFFLTCRFVNQRADRIAGIPATTATATVPDAMGAIGRGAA